MRTRKHFIAMAFIAIITLAIIGCKQEPTPQPSVTIGGKTIPVYKGAGVSDADFNTTYTALQNANYEGLSEKAKTYMQGITKIEIGGEVITGTSNTLKIPGGVTAPIGLINSYTNT
jgi:hypothetical protein